MSGPEARGFEHHSLGLACCQHSGWFRCHSQSFDRRRLIRACFSPSQAAAFRPRGSVFLFSPALLVQPRLMGTWSVRPFHVADNEVMVLSNTSSRRPSRLPPSRLSSLKSYVTSALTPNCSLSLRRAVSYFFALCKVPPGQEYTFLLLLCSPWVLGQS